MRVSDSDAEMLRFLSERGIAPGRRLEVLDKQPFEVRCSCASASDVEVLGGNLARAMRVEHRR